MIDYSKLENLPFDSGGIHSANPLGTTDAYYGYYIYTPSQYVNDGPQYPLLLFLHGAGERGNSATNTRILNSVLRNGPPMLIENKKWKPQYPMLVVTPQSHDGGWNTIKIHQFIKFLIDNYQINNRRIYITGLSMGGFGTFNYLTSTGYISYAAAAVPICGGGNVLKVKEMKHIPVWAFHGEDDEIIQVSNSVNMIKAINDSNPPVKAKLTVFPGVDHNSWSITYDGTGIGMESSDFDPFDMNIYNWMFQFEWNQFNN